MSKIWRFIQRDFSNVTKSVIAMVVCAGMVVVPSFYAWFNIAGSWDPYNNTANIKIALASVDEGYTSQALPLRINIGEQVIADLHESTKIGYEITTKDEAIEGVRSGEYYAAVVIPEDFSQKMMTVLSSDPQQAKVTFYTNEKANAIASIVTNKAQSSVQQQITQSFAASVVGVGAGTLSSLGDYLDDDAMRQVASSLDSAIDQVVRQLDGVASSLDTYGQLARSLQGLTEGTGDITTSSLSSALDLDNTLTSGSDELRSLASDLGGTTDGINTALQKGSDYTATIEAALDDAFDRADGHAEELSKLLADASDSQSVKALVEELQQQAEATQQAAYDQRQTLKALQQQVDQAETLDSAVKTRIKAAIASADSVLATIEAQAGANAKSLESFSSDLQRASLRLESGRTNARQTRQKLKDEVEQATSAITSLSTSAEQDVQERLRNLADTLDGAASDAATLKKSLDATATSLDKTAQATSRNLDDIVNALDAAHDDVTSASSTLDNLHTELAAALASDDIQQVRTILSSDPDDLATFISTPVTVDRQAIFPVANNGSAMAPFYTTLSIWIGGVILCALVRIPPSAAAIKETGAKPRHAYFGRISFFLVIGFMQTTLILLGDLYYLGIQCVHPGLFLLVGWCASLVFINIIYALTAAMGDVGKAVAVVLMVIQVAGSGGTFPREMLPHAFQMVYPFLPFVHAENAMRAAIAGVYQGDFWQELAILLVFIAPSLLLGLILKKPVERVNVWIEHNLEKTKFM